MAASTKKEKEKEKDGGGPKTIVFLHPDLGIGGAERLVVDAAVGLQKRGHKVVIFTSHCDPSHCFDETRDGTLDVRVRGNWLIPPTILGRFAILCAILRQFHLILSICLFSSELTYLKPTVFFVDQLSAGLPLLKSQSSAPIFFYCHFPDLLLARGRESLLKRLYRVPFDGFEKWSMSFADSIAVNSEFTKGIVAGTWPGLARKKRLEVVYPAIDISALSDDKEVVDEVPKPWREKRVFLSINRFERKKDVGLAIRAFAGLRKDKRRAAKLIVAGGYDQRVRENVEYHKELVELAEGLGLKSATATTLVSALSSAADEGVEVLFLLSVPGRLKEVLLRAARLLVYTPSNEHFGIVPIEGMLRGVPVLAADSGGPRETVVEGVTGWLRDPEEVGEWTGVMERVLDGGKELDEMGRKGRERVSDKFAVEGMAERLDGIFEELVKGVKQRVTLGDILMGLFGLGIVVFMVSVIVTMFRILQEAQTIGRDEL
ncbi:hypothetical protein OQA88_4994 [Cercophora sp. LCS_1]